MIETVKNNLECLVQILRFNVKHKILFFRITSDLVPFASHSICQFNWQSHFQDDFRKIGGFIRRHELRISMHPDQFVLINAVDNKIVANSLKELRYHAEVLKLMNLDRAAKIQIHVGGVYGNKERSIERFISRFKKLDATLKKHLVLENDDTRYGVKDCLGIHHLTGIPILLDTFHHDLNNHGEELPTVFKVIAKTWKPTDGIPMVDYSSQYAGKRKGSHVATVNMKHFRGFLEETKSFDFDIMLEIKDKETSALKILDYVSNDSRFVTAGS